MVLASGLLLLKCIHCVVQVKEVQTLATLTLLQAANRNEIGTTADLSNRSSELNDKACL